MPRSAVSRRGAPDSRHAEPVQIRARVADVGSGVKNSMAEEWPNVVMVSQSADPGRPFTLNSTLSLARPVHTGPDGETHRPSDHVSAIASGPWGPAGGCGTGFEKQTRIGAFNLPIGEPATPAAFSSPKVSLRLAAPPPSLPSVRSARAFAAFSPAPCSVPTETAGVSGGGSGRLPVVGAPLADPARVDRVVAPLQRPAVAENRDGNHPAHAADAGTSPPSSRASPSRRRAE